MYMYMYTIDSTTGSLRCSYTDALMHRTGLSLTVVLIHIILIHWYTYMYMYMYRIWWLRPEVTTVVPLVQTERDHRRPGLTTLQCHAGPTRDQSQPWLTTPLHSLSSPWHNWPGSVFYPVNNIHVYTCTCTCSIVTVLYVHVHTYIHNYTVPIRYKV